MRSGPASGRCARSARRGWHTVGILTQSLPPSLSRFDPRRIDPFQAVIVAVLLVAAVFVWSAVRDRVATPLDERMTEQRCADHGEDIGREALGHERSNRFGLRDRSVGYCFFGPGPDGEAPITLTIAQTEPGPLYRAAKWIGIIIQLGVVSIFLRLTIDPALDLYRYVRSAFS